MSIHGMEAAKATRGLLVPGDTCWRIEHADRLSVIVDGADYFLHLRAALRAAEQSIYMIGWDLDLRLEMVPGESDEDGLAPDGMPNRLGDFLKHIVATAPDVSLYILKWDKAVLVQLSQQLHETVGLKFASSRIHFALDSHHPTGATHHQKVVVVDDRFAFCGGIDVTKGRWDTRAHEPEDPRRRDPGGKDMKPWHDITTALSGPVAAALGDLARARWQAANGDALASPTADTEPWPEDLDIDLTGVDVAIARTAPDYRGQDAVDEIERLHLAAISVAHRTIYLESQYFASGTLCRALEDRLSEPDGPELVVINPDRAEGFLQHEVMDNGRARMIERMQAAVERGGGDRFRIYHPVNAADEPIYVHAKVLIVDDRLVRIGSSNVNNRSMNFDTECDVAFETADDAQRDFALGLRHALLAEHMGCEPADVAEAASDCGSLVGAVDRLNGRAERRLVAIDTVPRNEIEREAGDRVLFDERTYPSNRPRPLQRVAHGARRATAPYQFEAAGLAVAALALSALGIGVWAGVRMARGRRARRAHRFPAPVVVAQPAPASVSPPEPGRAPQADASEAVVAITPEPSGSGARAVVVAPARGRRR